MSASAELRCSIDVEALRHTVDDPTPQGAACIGVGARL